VIFWFFIEDWIFHRNHSSESTVVFPALHQ